MRHCPVAFVLAISACSSPLPSRPDAFGGSAEPSVIVEPDAAFDAVPVALRLSIGLPPGADPGDVLMFRDELSSYHLGSVQRGDLPSTLDDRIVPVARWTSAGGRAVLAPQALLEVGTRYDVAGPTGRLVSLRVAEPSGPVLRRRWPPTGAALRVVYCGARIAEPLSLWLGPDGPRATLSPGTAPGLNDDCARLTLHQPWVPESVAVPPPRVGEVWVDPTPLSGELTLPGAPAECLPGEVALGPGCARPEDDRVVVRSFGEASYWVVQAGSLTTQIVEAHARFVVAGLDPGADATVSVWVFDAAGRLASDQATFRLSEPLPRVVISEVLADPVGPEPMQEWVELHNTGRVAVDLQEWALEDSGGGGALPPAELPPGAFALVVAEEFDGTSPWDVVPAPGVVLVRVPELGASGLRNSGEPLLLRDPQGRIASRFPGVPKPKSGVSVARRDPDALDEAANGFGYHAAPGASPGTDNELEEPSD